MPCTCWRNLTTVVPVSGTVSTPRLLKSLSVPPALGAVRPGAASLCRAWARMRLAALSGSRFSGRASSSAKAAVVGRSAFSAEKVRAPAGSVTCMAKAVKPPALAACGAGVRFVDVLEACLDVFLATVASLKSNNRRTLGYPGRVGNGREARTAGALDRVNRPERGAGPLLPRRFYYSLMTPRRPAGIA